MISTTLEWLQGDDEDLVAKFQWMGHMLLKSATIIRYSEPLISSGTRATQEMKDLEEKVTFLRNEKLYWEKAKQKLTSEMNELKEATRLNDQQLEEARPKDQQLEESKIWISELKKDNADSFKVISKLRVDIKFIEQL